MIRPLASLALLLALAGCVTPAAPPPRAVVTARRAALPAAGLERVMGKDARALTALFGAADQDVREGTARKLQYAGAACVLDAYLYPPARGGGAVVTWVDARTLGGEDFDRASCVAALTRRGVGR